MSPSETNLLRFSLVLHTNFQLFGNERKKSDAHKVMDSPRIKFLAEPRIAWIRLNRLHTSVGHIRSWLHKWSMVPLRFVSVAQKNKPLTMLSSNVQFIDLAMDCTALRF